MSQDNNSQNKDRPNRPHKKGFQIPVDNDAVRERKKRQEKKLQDEIEKQQGKFTEGEILNFVRVRFPGHAKSLSFHVGNKVYVYGQKVVAMSERGMAVGYINSFNYEVGFKESMLPIRNINRVATQEDIDEDLAAYKKQKETETICIDLIEKYELDMNLTHIEFTQFGKKVVIYFTAPARVDFRNLVKDLVKELKLRIELRQISVRDRSASIGGIGPCGRQLCCSSFLDKYGAVNIKMAKNQNLTLSFSKLNGVCGQLKCCLTYEDEVYSAKRKKLPREQSFITTRNGDKGKVLRLHILSEQFDVLTERGVKKRFALDQFDQYLPKDYKFPERFKHISDETSNVIGLSDYKARLARNFQRDIDSLSRPNPKFAIDMFQDLFGEKNLGIVEGIEEKEKELLEKSTKSSKQIEVKEDVTIEFAKTSESDSETNPRQATASADRPRDSRDSREGERNNNRPRRNNNRRRNNKNYKGKKGNNNPNKKPHHNKGQKPPKKND